MKNIGYKGIYLVNFLCMLILSCEHDVVHEREPSELQKVLRDSKVNGILIIKRNISAFKSSYYVKEPSFRLSKKNKFNTEISFNKFGDEFKDAIQKDYVYASLRYEAEDIQILADIITLLVKDNMPFGNTEDVAFDLLKALRDVGLYVNKSINLILNPSFLYNMYNLHISNIAEVDKTIKTIFYLVNEIRSDIVSILKDLVRQANLSDKLDIRTIVVRLVPVTSKRGFIYEKIYEGNNSLKGLNRKLIKYL